MIGELASILKSTGNLSMAITQERFVEFNLD